MSALRSRVRLGSKAPLSQQELRQLDAAIQKLNWNTTLI